MSKKIMVLLVMPRLSRAELLEQLEACGADVLAASDCAEARRLLRTRSPLHVVIVDKQLPDGTWFAVLDEVRQNGLNTDVVVCIKRVDGGWTDLLERGAYDILIEPYAKEGLQRVVESAAARRETRLYRVAG